MKKIFILFLISFTSQLFAQTLRTVNLTFSGYTKYTTITDALSGAASGTTICVAAATVPYTEAELIIPPGVTVIGGYPTSATAPTQRVYPGVATAAQLSILNGNYSHRVATVQGTLDGFVITKGYVYDATTDNSKPMNGNGGGVMINGGIVQNCILHDNVAAKKAPTPGNIPGTFVASIGDIYCINGTNGTIVEPTYSVNSGGKYIATLPSGYSYNISTGLITTPDNTTITPLGVVFYVNPAATTANFLILGKPSKSVWSNPYQDSGLTDITIQGNAQNDMNGAANTQAINTYITTHFINISTYPTLQYVNSYPNLGTSIKWYIPAGGEMLKMWSVYPQIDACATLLTWETSSWFPSSPYWTSTEYSSQYEWILYANSYPSSPATLKAADQAGDADKTASNWVFPVASINY